MKKIFALLIIIPLNILSSYLSDLDSTKLVFIARKDGINVHYSNDQIYDNFLKDLKSEYDKESNNSKKNFIANQILVAQYINRALLYLFEEELKKSGHNFDSLKNTLILNQKGMSSGLWKSLSDAKKEELKKFIPKNIISKFDLIKTTWTGAIPGFKFITGGDPITINQKTFMLLNEYLQACFKYGVYLIYGDKDNLKNKINFIQSLANQVDSLKKKSAEFKDIIGNLVPIINFEHLRLKTMQKPEDVDLSNDLKSMNSYLNGLNKRAKEIG